MGYSFLPKKYWIKHDYLLYVYDVLGDMLRQADKKNLSNFTLKFEDHLQAESFEKSEDMFVWMDKNDYHDIALKLFNSHVFFSLLRDFCFYIYESLSCACRGKVTVAYSLLRKPLRDNLLYIEWLLADSEEFYQTFLYGSVADCDVSNYKKFTRERISKIIKSASNKSYMGRSINFDNIVYNFRFNSHDDTSLQRIWNQSMHLVTTSPNYHTEQGNLNFIFADDKIWGNYWNYYYLVLPQLLAYVLEICEAIFIKTTEVDTFELLLNRSIRFAKYAKIQPRIKSIKELQKHPYQLFRIIDEANILACFECENCNEEILLNEKVIGGMIDSWSIVCPHCGEEHNICKYYTDIRYLQKKSGTKKSYSKDL